MKKGCMVAQIAGGPNLTHAATRSERWMTSIPSFSDRRYRKSNLAAGAHIPGGTLLIRATRALESRRPMMR